MKTVHSKNRTLSHFELLGMRKKIIKNALAQIQIKLYYRVHILSEIQIDGYIHKYKISF